MKHLPKIFAEGHEALSAFHRRRFVQGTTIGAASIAFGALSSKSHQARASSYSPDYGPLYPTKDQATGLYLLELPRGFTYSSFGWTGQMMDDGSPTPGAHDGMAVVAKYQGYLMLVRNHEQGENAANPCIVDGGMYNPNTAGGTTNLLFDLSKSKFVESYCSLGGTIRNCAGGLTPWYSWLSCEETFHGWNGRSDGFNHGYIFDVPACKPSNGTPIRAAGRFSHEAVAVDPDTGIVYETEDSGSSAFYRYIPPTRSYYPEPLADGGDLEAMVVEGTSRMDLRGGFEDGTEFPVTWQPVGDPEGISGRAYDSAPDAAIIERGEGAWYDSGLIYFVSTSGGAANLGQIWAYDPERSVLTMIYEVRSRADADGPDNIAVSPRGGILLCEDGGSNPKRLIGLSPFGEAFEFARNGIDLQPGDIDIVDAVYPGVADNFGRNPVGRFTGSEWAGATFNGSYLFVNIQTPGVTFVITGPWCQGTL